MLFSACAFWRWPPQRMGGAGTHARNHACMLGRCSPCCGASTSVETVGRAAVDGQVAALGDGRSASLASRRHFIIKCACRVAMRALPAANQICKRVIFLRRLAIKLRCCGVAMRALPATNLICKHVISLRRLRMVASVQVRALHDSDSSVTHAPWPPWLTHRRWKPAPALAPALAPTTAAPLAPAPAPTAAAPLDKRPALLAQGCVLTH
jgi:hypothetical protein